MKQLFTIALCGLALSALACGDDDEKLLPVPEQPADAGAQTDASPEPQPQPQPDASTPADKAIPLILWVDDLLDHHTNDTSAPDTVDDKNIADDENPNTFDSRF